MDSLYSLQTPLAGWTVPRPVFKRLEVVAGPSGSVVDLAQLKAHLRVTHSSEDSYLDLLIGAATDAVEQYLSRGLLTRSLRMWMDFIPGVGNDYGALTNSAQVPIRYANMGTFRQFELMSGPVKEVTAVKYVTDAGVEVVWPSDQYLADYADQNMPGRIVLQRGAVWPTDMRVAKSLICEYKVGYGLTAAEVPRPLRHAVLLVAAALWSNRGDNADPQPDILQLPAIKVLLDPYRIRRVSLL